MSKPEHAHVSPQLKWSDYVFICLLCINLIGVILLGRNIYIQGDKLEQARKNAELVMAWAVGVGEDMNAGKPISPPKCTPASDRDLKTAKFQPNTWGECLADLFEPKGKFPEITNTFMKDGLIYVKKCDREHPESKGAMVLERLQTGPTGSPVVSELKDTDVLLSGMEFRISLCDRGFWLIKIGEAKL
jgi:hypothetical protein